MLEAQLPPEEQAIRHEFAKVTWCRSDAWVECRRRESSLEFGGVPFVIHANGYNGWRRDHDLDFWAWYAEKIYLDDVPRLECPVPKEQWPLGYAWHVWTDRRGATVCGFVLINHWSCGLPERPPCPLGDDCPGSLLRGHHV